MRNNYELLANSPVIEEEDSKKQELLDQIDEAQGLINKAKLILNKLI